MDNKRISHNPSLCAYASDASIYAIEPEEVIQPVNEKEIATAIEKAIGRGLSITPRGGGTGLAGGALGSGIILDFGKYNGIIEVDLDRRLVQTRVGIVYDELNRALHNGGLFFPRAPSGPVPVYLSWHVQYPQPVVVVCVRNELSRLRSTEVESDNVQIERYRKASCGC